jgi:hypothetical protein
MIAIIPKLVYKESNNFLEFLQVFKEYVSSKSAGNSNHKPCILIVHYSTGVTNTNHPTQTIN